MQLLYCDKYVDQGTWWVISFQLEAGLHSSQSTEEVSWGAGGAQPPSPRGQKQKLPSTFPRSASPRPRMPPSQPAHCPFSGQTLYVPLFTSCSQRPWNQDSHWRTCERGLKAASWISQGNVAAKWSPEFSWSRRLFYDSRMTVVHLHLSQISNSPSPSSCRAHHLTFLFHWAPEAIGRQPPLWTGCVGGCLTTGSLLIPMV